MKRLFPAVILIGLLLSPSLTWQHEAPRSSGFKMVRQPVEGQAPEFALVDQAGQPLALKDLRGKVVLLTFIYTSCSDVCSLITAAMTVLQRRLAPEERARVFFISVTVDPKVDTPAVLQAYARRHGADLASWAFLTGDPKVVQEVWQSFGLTVTRRAKGVVDHPAVTLMIDKEGMVRYRYFGGILDVETVLEDIRSIFG